MTAMLAFNKKPIMMMLIHLLQNLPSVSALSGVQWLRDGVIEVLRGSLRGVHREASAIPRWVGRDEMHQLRGQWPPVHCVEVITNSNTIYSLPLFTTHDRLPIQNTQVRIWATTRPLYICTKSRSELKQGEHALLASLYKSIRSI